MKERRELLLTKALPLSFRKGEYTAYIETANSTIESKGRNGRCRKAAQVEARAKKLPAKKVQPKRESTKMVEVVKPVEVAKPDPPKITSPVGMRKWTRPLRAANPLPMLLERSLAGFQIHLFSGLYSSCF
jgi:hypothetical protein